MMLKAFYSFLFDTLRGRLIVSVAVVHAMMMSLFIVDLTLRQRAMFLDRQADEAIALSHALATSAAGWIAAYDISGLQELVEAQKRYPELLFAVLVNQEGLVLANTDRSKMGLYLYDLPKEARQTVFSRTPALVDVAAPAVIQGRLVGWARVGIGQKAAGEKLAEITRSGALYALAAIVLGSVIAWLMGRRITRRLYVVQETINKVRAGDRMARSSVTGADEAAMMAKEFNSMLDAVAVRDKELRAGEEKYRELIQKIDTAVVVHGPDTSILTSNPLAQQLLGLTEEQMLGKQAIDPAWHFFREDGTVMPLEEYPVNRALATGQPLRDLVVGVHRPGTEEDVWVLVSAAPIFDEHGELTQIIVSFIDITDRKKMEEALAAREREFRTLAENSPDSIARYDADCRTLYINPTLEKTLGRPTSEILGTTPGNEFREHREKIVDMFKTGKSEEMDLILPDSGDGVRYHNIRFVPEQDADGRIIGVQSIGRDITERMQAEKELKKHREHLEELVQERTAELEATNKELEAFTYYVSHDLRAPLRHITGFIELLQKKAGAVLDEKSRHYMGNISDAANKMGLLIDDLLSFSRMGRHTISFQKVDLGNLAHDIVREVEPDTGGRGITWQIGDLPSVEGDAAMLRIVLANLITNAVKFTRSRAQAEIEIGWLRSEDTETVVFVRDNGVGFEMTYADKLFGVFQRLHRQEEFEGTGIGLANARRIINRHGGRTWAEGEIDHGATFYFSLPRPKQKRA